MNNTKCDLVFGGPRTRNAYVSIFVKGQRRDRISALRIEPWILRKGIRYEQKSESQNKDIICGTELGVSYYKPFVTG
jgi:hypothetical protein